MWRKLRILVVVIMMATTIQLVAPTDAEAANVTLPADGIVSVELITSSADFSNSLSIGNAGVAIADTGCSLEPAGGLTGLPLLSEKRSQRGCRVVLDADSATAGIQPFTAGTALEFRMCAQIDGDGDCEFVWSSDPSANSDGNDHVQLTPVGTAAIQMAWEDQDGLGDNDFNDLIAVVRFQNDRDGDALWDDWEEDGVDTNGDGMIDLDLPALGADPDVPDIFIEIDYFDCDVAGSDCPAGDSHDHRPKQAALDAVEAAFLVQGINLHAEIGNAIAHADVVGGCPIGADFDAVKADPANFGPDNPRRFTHHYALFAHRIFANRSTSGCGELPGNDFIVSLGDWNTTCVRAGANGVLDTAPTGDDIVISGILRTGPNLTCDTAAMGDDTTSVPVADSDGDGLEDRGVGTIAQQAGTLMHELGHNIDLRHGGDDNVNNKPNYLSVMNYSFQFGFLDDPDGGGPLTSGFDYSGSVLAALNEASLAEGTGIGGAAGQNTRWNCPGGGVLWDDAEFAIDWDCDGTISGSPSVDSNGSGAIDNNLTSHDDWENIRYDFQNTTDFEDGVHETTIGEPEPTFEDYEEFEAAQAANLAVTLSASVDPVLSGATTTYAINVENKGIRAGDNVRVVPTLPPDVIVTSCVAPGGTCVGTAEAPEVTYAAIEPDQTVSISLVAEIACAVADGTAATASVEVSADEADPFPADNVAETTITVLNPPPMIEGLTPSRSRIWPPNHKMVPIDLAYDVVDNCGEPDLAVSVTSDQPIDGLGDGNTDIDWVVHSPTAIEVRAERSQGTNRVYMITVQATDSAGSIGTAETTVVVGR